jgi:hypothetical protein
MSLILNDIPALPVHFHLFAPREGVSGKPCHPILAVAHHGLDPTRRTGCPSQIEGGDAKSAVCRESRFLTLRYFSLIGVFDNILAAHFSPPPGLDKGQPLPDSIMYVLYVNSILDNFLASAGDGSFCLVKCPIYVAGGRRGIPCLKHSLGAA